MRDEFLPYTTEDFLECDAFLAWQRQPERHALARAWEDWLRQNPDKMEAVDHAKRLLKELQPAALAPSRIDVDALWKEIEDKTSASGTAQKGKMVKMWPRLAAAAAIALIAVFYYLTPQSTTLEVRSGQHLAYSLPDDSEVFIQADSRLSFSKNGFNQEREVFLKGTAFFDVESGNTFRVTTDQGQVEVLGTEFTVSQRALSFEVRCQEGKVRVTAEDQHPLTLTAGQAVAFDGKNLNRFELSPRAQRVGWVFTYQDVPLSEIFSEMERQYAVTVQYPDSLKEIKHTGLVDMTNLPDALDNLAYSYSFTHTISNQQVIISIE